MESLALDRQHASMEGSHGEYSAGRRESHPGVHNKCIMLL